MKQKECFKRFLPKAITKISSYDYKKEQHDSLPLPPKISNRFSTMVAECPHLGVGADPVIDNSIHWSDTCKVKISSQELLFGF